MQELIQHFKMVRVNRCISTDVGSARHSYSEAGNGEQPSSDLKGCQLVIGADVAQ